jgi:hypothetical protein
MAVDYFHFLVVSGHPAAVDDFVYRIALVINRRVAGKSLQQTVPFSFQSMYKMARMKGDPPADPFDMARWPIVQRGRLAEVRYRFHTRSLELHPLIKRLSKWTPRLTFALVTWCLDNMDFAPFSIRKGKLRGTWLGDDWRSPFWERAAREHNIPLDEAYDDEMVERVAENRMTDAAVQIATGTNRRYEWRGGRTYRCLEDERADAMMELARAMGKMKDDPE